MEKHWCFIKLAFNTSAKIVIIPFQDLYGLTDSARVNTPGTIIVIGNIESCH